MERLQRVGGGNRLRRVFSLAGDSAFSYFLCDPCRRADQRFCKGNDAAPRLVLGVFPGVWSGDDRVPEARGKSSCDQRPIHGVDQPWEYLDVWRPFADDEEIRQAGLRGKRICFLLTGKGEAGGKPAWMKIIPEGMGPC